MEGAKIFQKSESHLTLALYSSTGIQTVMNENGTCDAFVEVIFGTKREKTAIIHDTYDPIWNQLFCWEVPSFSSRFQSLELKVYNHNDKRAHDYIGKVVVESHYVTLGGIFTVPITKKGFPGQSQGTLSFQLLNAQVCIDGFQQGLIFGTESLDLREELITFGGDDQNVITELPVEGETSKPNQEIQILERAEGHFAVLLMSGSGLPKVDTVGSCDAYVKFMIGTRVVAQSEPVSDSLDPVWNTLYGFKLSPADLGSFPGMTIEIYDYNVFQSHRYLGKIFLEWPQLFLGGIFKLPILSGMNPNHVSGKKVGFLQFQIFSAQIILVGFTQGMEIGFKEREALTKFAERTEIEIVTDLRIERAEPSNMENFESQHWLEASEEFVLVAVLAGSNLPKMDYLGLSDPYVNICVGDCIEKTDIQYYTLFPVWDQLFLFKVDTSYSDRKKALKFECYDYDYAKDDDFIGDVLLQWTDIDGTVKELQLSNGSDSEGSISVIAAKCNILTSDFKQGMKIDRTYFQQQLQHVLGTEANNDYEHQLLKKCSTRRRLRSIATEHLATLNNWIEFSDQHLLVVVLSASNLPKMDIFGLSDPYINVFFGEKTYQTKIRYYTLEPEWDQLFCFELSSLKREDHVRFEVYDYDHLKDDDYIGQALLQWSDIDSTEKDLQITGAPESQGSIKVLAVQCKINSSEFTQGMKVHRAYFKEQVANAMGFSSNPEEQMKDIPDSGSLEIRKSSEFFRPSSEAETASENDIIVELNLSSR